MMMDFAKNSNRPEVPSLSEMSTASPRTSSPNTPPTYTTQANILPLNINIQVIGSRGDVQPFIALGAVLKQDGHRVRISTHAQFKDFVKSSGVEFFDVGGDPEDLMAFMVDTPTMIPTVSQIRAGLSQKKRSMFARMLNGLWQSCIAADGDSHIPFVADAIIANPPSYAHVHCAQALGIPVHLMFTMPWSSTKEFPHPLATASTSKMDSKMANYASYALVEMLTWQGLGDLVNRWRTTDLGLEPIPGNEAHRLLEVLQVPFTYCWSPSFIPKPADWGKHIDVCGFLFREPPEFLPTTDLETFLQAGSTPVYIGFGSIVSGEGENLLDTVLSAVRLAGVRAIISQGWSKLQGESSEDIFFISDCPHEWLFQQVAAVVHHGGAGTTACGLRHGRPTVVVPFFGDQPFWGSAVARAGAGPEPIPHRVLTSQRLAEAIAFCLRPETQQAAAKIAKSLRAENGTLAAVKSFYANMPLGKMRCYFRPDQPAALVFGRGERAIPMSKPVASILAKTHEIDLKDLLPYRPKPIVIESIRWDPLTAVSAASLSTLLKVIGDTADVFIRPAEAHRKSNGLEALEGRDRREVARQKRTSNAPSFVMIPIPDVAGSGRLQNILSCAPRGNPRGALAPNQEHALSPTIPNAVGKVIGNYTKGVLVDIPLALTEGLRAVPRLYGQPMDRHEAVSDLRTGVSVAGQTFYEGITASVTDVFKYTYEGKKQQGAAGAAKGLAKGAASLLFKSSSAFSGLVSFPAQGIYRSIWAKTHQTPMRAIVMFKVMEGDWIVSMEPKWNADQRAIVLDFAKLRPKS